MTAGIAADRLISASLSGEVLPSGDGTTTAVLGTFGSCEMGLWEIGPGIDEDVEVDEVFLVLSGAGTVEFADSTTIELRPGVLVRLRAGDRTRWHVVERLRKLYLA